MNNLKIIRSFEPQKGNNPNAKLDGYFEHPNRVREFVAIAQGDGTYQEVRSEGYCFFENGFCRNYKGRGGIAWIVGDAPKGTSYHTPDKFYPAPSELNEFHD